MQQQILFATAMQVLLFVNSLSAQQQNDIPPSSFTIALNHDNVFGFYPAAYGSLGLKENLSFTYYGILWTNPSFGNVSTGTNSWLETGAGLGFSAGAGKWYFNPFLGFTHGKLLSGGTKGVIGDGIVPGISAFYNDGKFEMEAFACWYKALRNGGPVTTDYALFWLLPGIRLTESLSAGIHYEGFVQTKGTSLNPETQYQTLGAYFKILAGGKYAFRLSVGKNFKKDIYSNEFYKLRTPDLPAK